LLLDSLQKYLQSIHNLKPPMTISQPMVGNKTTIQKLSNKRTGAFYSPIHQLHHLSFRVQN
jgi:hypothetical protein